MKKLLYRPAEVAEMLSFHVNTVYELVREGKLRAHNEKPGTKGMRIIASSVEEYIERHIIPPDTYQQ